MNTNTIQEKLVTIQKNLKVPKNNRNSFGNYNYRSCEDILESVKPLLDGCTLVINDEIVNLGDRFYVKATVTLAEGKESITASAYARESQDKKGMDDAQITGSASSYARKYALNGLFAIDDTKDADTMDNAEHVTKQPVQNKQPVNTVQNHATGNPVPSTEHFCTIHNKPMKERTSTQGGTWYDHRWQVNGVWQQCNGKPKAEVVEEEYNEEDFGNPEFNNS